MSFLLAIAVSVLAIFFDILLRLLKPKEVFCTGTRRVQQARQGRNILNHSTLEERAKPNERLVRVFEIENAFTTTDPTWHKEFVALVKTLLRTSDKDWKEHADFASDTIHQVVDTTSTQSTLELTVQALVFRLVIVKFFPDTPAPSMQDIHFITLQINSLWIASKYCNSGDSELVSAKMHLRKRIQQVFGSDTADGQNNPLNIILPAYETLWRIVLRTFLEVRFRSTITEREQYRILFRDFMDKPSKDSFEQQNESHASVHTVVTEALRLYPPTRRIYRDISGERVAIDIEHLHRDENVWGKNAFLFQPTRWATENGKENKRSYMPFGAGKFECPAKSTFGPMLIGILVGALLSGIDGKFELNGKEGIYVLNTRPLENGRQAYSQLGFGRRRDGDEGEAGLL
ncbi:Cytochrome P450 [Hyphodiscus hymeniophilus]|uniref:Cytochrome P450 n=1 Tax=Hyphodiscus hymeniophilus TaxID=353542 RepID=A0A9P6VN93_9HELO|nr:Cytochrome P450 [Hyphodiscus hymeniophilus]